MGKAYLCDPFDSHMLPREVLFDGAARDCKPHAHINSQLEGGRLTCPAYLLTYLPRSADVINSLSACAFCQNYTWGTL